MINFLCYVLGGIENKALKLDQMPSRFSWVFSIDGSDSPDSNNAGIERGKTDVSLQGREVIK
jgi:hypothetical protein